MPRNARLIVLGKQGAGKGTQCVRLSHHYAVAHIATGDMLRAAARARTELGLEARKYTDAGELVPDEIVLRMVNERLDLDDTRTKGFILDGFPRNVGQAEALDEIVQPVAIDAVVNLAVPTSVVLKRLASRRVCVDCGTNYSTDQPPRVDWICDVCGGEVIQRDDDTEAAIKRRLDLYEVQTAPLISHYRHQNKLHTVRGAGAPNDVTERLVSAVDQALDKRGERP